MANIEYLLALCKTDKSLLINFIGLQYPRYRLVFDRFGRAGKNSSIQILEDTSKKEFYLRNFNQQKYAIPNGNLSVQILRVTEHLEGWDRAKAQIKILNDLGIDTPQDTQGSQRPQIATIRPASPAPSLRINQHKSTSNIILEYCDFAKVDGSGRVSITPLGKSVLDYFDSKCGVTLSSGDAVFGCFGIRPVKSKTIIKNGRKFKFNYTPENFAFSYQSGDAIKIKQPTQPKFKNIWVQNVHDYVFGFDSIIGDGDICLICGGEDDAICINTHFCDASPSVVAVAVGSETKPINPLLVERLKRDFQTVAICFDFDDVGIFNAQKNAQKLQMPYLNFCNTLAMMGYEPNGMKDVCDVYRNLAIKNLSYGDFINSVRYTIQDSI